MKIYIRQIPATINNEIFIINEPAGSFKNGDVITFFNFKETGEVIGTQRIHNVGEFMEMKPTMILGERETRELIMAFQVLAKEQDIEVESESRAKGKLEATSEHLKDLRKLLKL